MTQSRIKIDLKFD